jgi:anhydro-N-acetylmuramic acid kinase
MKDDILRLSEISVANERLILGLMSGTSLDGLDIALCRVQGHGISTKLTLLAFETTSYHTDFKLAVKSIFAKQTISHAQLCWLNACIARTHADMIMSFLSTHSVQPEQVDLIASHGQTVFHYPHSLRPSLHTVASESATPFNQADLDNINSTLQLGDGDHIASLTGIITISDFRQKHIAHGGEGAPLAAYGDYLLFANDNEPRCLINIGGIANLTYLPTAAKFSQLICSDVGPGNTIMDALVSDDSSLDGHFDIDGKLAASGKVNADLLSLMLTEVFLQLPLPKTTGPELFNLSWFNSLLSKLGLGHATTITTEDKLATLCEYSAICITQQILRFPLNTSVYVSGGGFHNTHLCARISSLLDRPLYSTQQLGVNPDAKEAILFALLANECVAGDQTTFASNNDLPSQNNINTSMGKVCLPS